MPTAMPAADSAYLLLFTAGLLGGAGHCIGMCGPIVLAGSMALGRPGIGPHLLYHLGRTTTYALLGGLTGFAGSWVSLLDPVRPLQAVLMGSAGLLVVVLGLGMAGWVPLVRRLEERAPHSRLVARLTRLCAGGASVGALYPMGLALGLLPCGMVYSALATSARVGMEAESHAAGFARGFSLMLLFGLGTIPALLLFGQVAGRLGLRLRAALLRASALLVVALGLLFVVRAVRLLA